MAGEAALWVYLTQTPLLSLVISEGVADDQHVAVGEQELEILGIEAHALDRLRRAEADVVLAAVAQVLEFDLHIGAALAGLRMLDLHRAPDAAFVFDDVAGTDVHAADLGHARCLRFKMGKSRKGAPLAAWLGRGKVVRPFIFC